MAIPPWAWVLIGLLILLIGAWSTNVACPAFGRSCKATSQVTSNSSETLTPEQLKVLESYF